MSELAVEKTSLNKVDATPPFSDYCFSDDPFGDNFTAEAINAVTLSGDEPIPFFMGGDRRNVLDEVTHLCQFSQHLVAVLGEAGVGKTAFTYQAVVELRETARCCVLRSTVMLTVADVLQQLVDQLGLFVSETATNEEILQVIEQYRPTGHYQRAILIVDDAHHLSNDVLALFVHLLQYQASGYLHILLVGDSSLLLRLDELDKGDVLVYDIPLCPFTIDELEYYLSFKLAAVGYDGAELFDYDMLSVIWKETRGIPASVNRVANKLLLSRSTLDDEGARLGLPISYMAILVVLLAALIMAIFYVGDEPQNPESSDVPAELSVEPVPKSSSVVEGQEKTVLDAVASVETVIEPAVEVTPEPQQDAAEENVEKAALEVGGNVVSNNVPEQLEEQALLQEAPVVLAENEPEVVQEKVVAPSTSSAESLPPPVSAASVPPKLTVDEEAILFWPSEAYTLQVMAAGQLEGVKRFVEVQPNRRQLRIVAFERNDAPWYVVLVGVYETIPEARQAISDLPPVQAKAKPWPRKISDVQQNIREISGR